MARSYCVTLNNYTLDDMSRIYESRNEFRYIILGAEVGKNGTKHLQGYFELKKPQRITYFKNNPELGLAKAHLEPRKGTRDEARKYCMKDQDFWENGEWSAGGQGQRNDLKEVMKLIREDKPIMEVMEAMPSIVSNNLRFVEKYKVLCDEIITREKREVEVVALDGDTLEENENLARKETTDIGVPLFIVKAKSNFPFNGYNGEANIFIDYAEGPIKGIPYHRITSGNQLLLDVKCGHTYARWAKVYFSPVTRFRNEVVGNTEATTSIMDKSPFIDTDED